MTAQLTPQALEAIGASGECTAPIFRTPSAGCGEVVYQGPKRFTAEEAADGNVGIRWVTAEAVMGRPSSHDVMEYLKRDKGAMCNCDQCTTFFPALAATGEYS